MLVVSNSNQLPFLGTMRGEQKLDDRGYRRIYRPFGKSDNIRKEFATIGNSQSAEGFKKIGNDYNKHHDRSSYFIPLRGQPFEIAALCKTI